MGSLKKRGASRMPGTMPSLGNTCLTTSSPVSAPVAAFTPPTMSAAVIFGRVKNGAGNGQSRCAVAFAAVDQGDAHSAIIIEAGRIVLVRREHGLLLLHDQLFQQDAGLVDLCNAVIHLNGLVGQFSDVLCIRRIQDVTTTIGEMPIT